MVARNLAVLPNARGSWRKKCKLYIEFADCPFTVYSFRRIQKKISHMPPIRRRVVSHKQNPFVCFWDTYLRAAKARRRPMSLTTSLPCEPFESTILSNNALGTFIVLLQLSPIQGRIQPSSQGGHVQGSVRTASNSNTIAKQNSNREAGGGPPHDP
ncbi:hypothetical protein EVAR_80147_1 [Eumeta japonica]|uniref:Uncharacterized protein n=1 Tax=Eumeta variegata TaxID=151549 RepID=A0A4C1YGF1_EUMVA|nr:hypothetical protein EVAR_80147_1 [Eumeta japonica]